MAVFDDQRAEEVCWGALYHRLHMWSLAVEPIGKPTLRVGSFVFVGFGGVEK